MSILEALLLAIAQGLTEFLPVSSSGHLVVLEYWLGLQPSEFLFFDIILHVGTLVSVIVFYHKSILRLLKSLLPASSGETTRDDRMLIGAILLSTFITGVLGFAIKAPMEEMRDQLVFVGIAFIATGLLLASTRLRAAAPDDAPLPMNLFLFAAIMGVAQAIAILPGISRSGTTVSVALLMGVSSKRALEYSFLMSIPAIVGAAILELKDAEIVIPATTALLGFVASMVSGLIFLYLLVWIVKRGQLWAFAAYTIPLGIAVILLSA